VAGGRRQAAGGRKSASPTAVRLALVSMSTVTDAQRRFGSVMTDVLIYVVVINLFVEYSDSVVIDSFTISIFTAVVLKILLDLILALEHKVSAYFERQNRPISKVLQISSVWAILFLSKFVILEVVDIVFGEHVELGGFLMVIALVLAMMIAREAFARIYAALGTEDAGDE
jgi:hypothetical protein